MFTFLSVAMSVKNHKNVAHFSNYILISVRNTYYFFQYFYIYSIKNLIFHSKPKFYFLIKGEKWV